MSADKDIPLRKVIDKQGTTWLKYPDTFRQPMSAPRDVLCVTARVVSTSPIGFTEIKWGVGKHHVDHTRGDARESFKAISLKKHSIWRRIKRPWQCEGERTNGHPLSPRSG